MIKKKIIYIFVFFNLQINYIFNNPNKEQFDLTIVGSLNFSGSLARLSVGIIDTLKDDFKINFIPTNEFKLTDISDELKKIVQKNNKKPGKVTLFTDILWFKFKPRNHFVNMIPNSKIKIAYSMLESTLIPKVWVNLLNSRFDAVVVPDEFLIEVYRNSGVTIPIFVLPLGLYLEDFLKRPEKVSARKPFVFGCSAVAWERKNLKKMIKAFHKAFGTTNKVQLKIHTKDNRGVPELKNLIKNLNAKNVQIIPVDLPWKIYIDFFSMFDCYVLISKGEGFSITPREALALGIPCILSNNTGHKVICNSGLVCSVPSKILQPAYYDVFDKICGNQFDCTLEDAKKAFLRVYNNYQFFLDKAKKGRIWVQQYLYKNLKNKYVNLIKPKKVIFGAENIITDEYLMTNSQKLYNKYLSL